MRGEGQCVCCGLAIVPDFRQKRRIFSFAGNAVIVCDLTGCGALVSTRNFDKLRRLNFGIRTLRAPATADILVEEIARYDADDCAQVCPRVRQEADLEGTVDNIAGLYEEVIAEYKQQLPPRSAGGTAHRGRLSALREPVAEKLAQWYPSDSAGSNPALRKVICGPDSAPLSGADDGPARGGLVCPWRYCAATCILSELRAC